MCYYVIETMHVWITRTVLPEKVLVRLQLENHQTLRKCTWDYYYCYNWFCFYIYGSRFFAISFYSSMELVKCTFYAFRFAFLKPAPNKNETSVKKVYD
jgi:hypothetical protein